VQCRIGISCSSLDELEWLLTTSSQIDNAEIVRSVHVAAAAGNTLRLLDVLAPDVEWKTAAGSLYAGTYIGPYAVLDGVFAKLGSEWSAFVAEPQTFVDHGDTVAVVGTYRPFDLSRSWTPR
jgi:ketosteroid isomerase-like protein